MDDKTPDLPVIDMSDYPEINSEGIADFYVIGTRVRFALFDWYKIDGVFRRKIVGIVTHSSASMRPGTIHALEKRFGANPKTGEQVH
jgi:hypothetical protein